jgi:hypothetical protein
MTTKEMEGEGEGKGEEGGFWGLNGGGITEIIGEGGSGKTKKFFLPLPGRIDRDGIRPAMAAADVDRRAGFDDEYDEDDDGYEIGNEGGRGGGGEGGEGGGGGRGKGGAEREGERQRGRSGSSSLLAIIRISISYTLRLLLVTLCNKINTIPSTSLLSTTELGRGF